MEKEIKITIKVSSDLEARQVEKALEVITSTFKSHELVKISKKIELPMVLMKIKAMI